jgi:hypothetical protein
METTEPLQKKGGISRRAVIVNGAVGAAAFWSVPVIESVTQRAAAQSGGISLCSQTNISWAYIFWLDTSMTTGTDKTVYVTAFKGGNCVSNFAADGSSNPQNTLTTSDCTEGTFSIISFVGGPVNTDFTYSGVSGASPTSGNPTADTLGTGGTQLGCSFLVDNGTTITSNNSSFVLLGGIGFSGGNLFDLCNTSSCPGAG